MLKLCWIIKWKSNLPRMIWTFNDHANKMLVLHVQTTVVPTKSDSDVIFCLQLVHTTIH